MVTLSIVVALLLVINAAGVVLVAFQLPGTWVILAATGISAWVLWERGTIGFWTLGLLLVLAILGEVVETTSGAYGTRRAGGSRRGAVLSIVVGIAGAIVGGSLAGSLSLAFVWLVPAWLAIVLAGGAVGAAIGALLGDRLAGRTWPEAGKAGLGAAVGRLGGTVGKMAIAAAMWAVAVAAVFV